MAKLKQEPPKTVKLMIVQGVEGRSVYLSRVQVAGPRPVGHGKIIEIWDLPVEKVRAVLGDR